MSDIKLGARVHVPRDVLQNAAYRIDPDVEPHDWCYGTVLDIIDELAIVLIDISQMRWTVNLSDCKELPA